MQVPSRQEKAAAQEKVKSNQSTSSQPRSALHSSSAPYPALNTQSQSPKAVTETGSKTLPSDNPQPVPLAQPEMITRSKSRSSQAATARQRARNQRLQRATSQSAASSQPTENSSRSRRSTTRRGTRRRTVSAQSPAATSSQTFISSESVTPSQVFVSSESAVPSQAITSSQEVASREDNPHGITALQQEQDANLAPGSTEATHHLLASQSAATPYSAITSQHVYPQSVYPDGVSSQHLYQQNGYSPALVTEQPAYPPADAPHHPNCPNYPFTRESAATQMPMNDAEFLSDSRGSSQFNMNFVPYAQEETSMANVQPGEGNSMMEYLMPQDPESLTGTNGTAEIYAGALHQHAQMMQAAYPYGAPQNTMMSPAYAHPNTVPPEAHYNTLYAAAPSQYGNIQPIANQINGALALQQPQNMAAPNYPGHYNMLASQDGVQSQSFPILRSQGPNNEPYMPYAHQASTHGPQLQNSFHNGVQGTTWQDRPAIRRSSLGDQSDIQEVSGEAWQAANRANMGRKAMSRARSIAPSLLQNALQRHGSVMPATSQQVSRVNGQTAGRQASQLRTQHPSLERRELANSQAPVTPRRAPPGMATQTSPTQDSASSEMTFRTAATSGSTTALGATAAPRTPLPSRSRDSRSSILNDGPRYRGNQREIRPRVNRNQARDGGTQRTQPRSQTQERSRQFEAQAQAPAPEPSVQAQEQRTQAQYLTVRIQEQVPQPETPQSPIETHRLPLPTPESLRQPRPPRLPVFEPRIQMIIPIFISGATLVPPPYRMLAISYQVQQSVLVEAQEEEIDQDAD